MSYKTVGKIARAWFGAGGYQEAQLGWSFVFTGDGWGSGDFWGHWNSPPRSGSEWTEESRQNSLGKDAIRVSQILRDAKVNDFHDLIGKPIEVTFEYQGGRLESWRILTEVL